jgi:hypothetical protein
VGTVGRRSVIPFGILAATAAAAATATAAGASHSGNKAHHGAGKTRRRWRIRGVSWRRLTQTPTTAGPENFQFNAASGEDFVLNKMADTRFK